MQELNKKMGLIQEKENVLLELEKKLQRWYIVLQEKEQELVEQEKEVKLESLLETHFASRRNSLVDSISRKQ